MNILITGPKKLSIVRDFYKNQQLKVVPAITSFINACEALGHHVTQRSVNIGETLKEYDKVIVIVGGIADHIYKWFPQMLWALHVRRDAIVCCDDWQIDRYLNFGMKNKTVEQMQEKLFGKFCKSVYKTTCPEYVKYENEMMEAMISGVNGRYVIYPMFPGGDIKLMPFTPGTIKMEWYPEPFSVLRHPQFDKGTKITKSEHHVLAGITQPTKDSWMKKNKCNWPIEVYGSMKKDGLDEEVAMKNGNVIVNRGRVTEPEIVNRFALSWSNILPGYKHAGSGWWRARPLQSILAKSILICNDNREAKVYGESFCDLTPSKIESMSGKERVDLIKAQKADFLKNNPMSKELVLDQVKDILS